MPRTIITKSALILIVLCVLVGCFSNSSHLDDPNALVVVTSQYEGSAEKIILPSTENCSPSYDCADKKGANCATALYNNALDYIESAIKLERKEMYLAARVEFLMATCRLIRAQSVLNDAKLTNYNDWKVAHILGLDDKIKNKMKFCQQRTLYLEWRR